MAASNPTKDTDETPDQAPILEGEAPTSSLEEVLEKHGKKIAFLLLAALAVVGAVLFMRTKSRLAQKKANEAFTSAATRDDLKSVADQYSGTTAGGNALLMLADRQLAAGKDEDARISLTQFVKSYDKSPLYSNGAFALATLNEKMGKIDEAETGFRSIASNGAADPLSSFASVRLGDLLANKGKLDEAKDIYTNFAASFPGAPLLAEMRGSGFWSAIEGRELLIDHKITLRDQPAPAPEPEPEPKEKPDLVPSGFSPPPTGRITEGAIPVPADGSGVKLEDITIPAPTSPAEATEGAAGKVKAAAEKAVNAGAGKAADLKGAADKAAEAVEAVKEIAP